MREKSSEMKVLWVFIEALVHSSLALLLKKLSSWLSMTLFDLGQWIQKLAVSKSLGSSSLVVQQVDRKWYAVFRLSDSFFFWFFLDFHEPLGDCVCGLPLHLSCGFWNRVRKIRLQVQGETAKVEGAKPKGAIHIIRQLGVLGLYKGSLACLLRDIPFSAVYFTSYSHLKTDVFQEGYNGKRLSFLETLSAAAIAGMPAAYLTTPAGKNKFIFYQSCVSADSNVRCG